MRLLTFRHGGGRRVGALAGEEVVDLADAGLPADLVTLAGSPEARGAVRRAVEAARRRIPLAAVTLEAPVPRPPKLLAIGLNYADHLAESRGPGTVRPEHPIFFNKQSTCVIGSGEAIEVPRVSSAVDYEGELAFVIARRCRHVPRERAPDVVAGFTICNDVSVRDWQRRTPTLTLGKSFDTHGPLGPWLVTPDELGDPHDLGLRTFVNGELRQDARTGDMLFDCWEQVARLSEAMTLEPGDVISTGTPAGVGAARQPPAWLRAGDRVRIEIEGIGALENPVIDEPEPAIRAGWTTPAGNGRKR